MTVNWANWRQDWFMTIKIVSVSGAVLARKRCLKMSRPEELLVDEKSVKGLTWKPVHLQLDLWWVNHFVFTSIQVLYCTAKLVQVFTCRLCWVWEKRRISEQGFSFILSTPESFDILKFGNSIFFFLPRLPSLLPLTQWTAECCWLFGRLSGGAVLFYVVMSSSLRAHGL